MTASQKRSIRKAFLEVHFDQLGMAGLSMKQLKKFIMKPHRTMGCIPYWALLLHIGEEASPFLCVTWAAGAATSTVVHRGAPWFSRMHVPWHTHMHCRYLVFDQILAPLLVTNELIRKATAPNRKQQLQNKAMLDERFIKYIRKHVKIPNGLLSFDDFVRVTVVLSTYRKLELLRLLFNLFDKVRRDVRVKSRSLL